jgi:transcriptional regulator with XRE-family HTH domain
MSRDIRVLFGDRIRRLRKRSGMTQMELAEMLGVNRSYLSQVEAGKRDPGLRLVKSIADGLHTSMSKLLSKL